MHCTLWMLLIPCFALAQDTPITFTKSFTRKMEKAQIAFFEPVELWLHVVPMRSDGFMRYDLVLQNDRNTFEMRIRVRRKNEGSQDWPIHVEVPRLASSVSTNYPDSQVRVTVPDSAFMATHFNAHGGTFANFTPKRGFSEKPYGSIITLVHRERPAVDVVVLYEDPSYSPLDAFRNIRYR
jgi:hypothetical protein